MNLPSTSSFSNILYPYNQPPPPLTTPPPHHLVTPPPPPPVIEPSCNDISRKSVFDEPVPSKTPSPEKPVKISPLTGQSDAGFRKTDVLLKIFENGTKIFDPQKRKDYSFNNVKVLIQEGYYVSSAGKETIAKLHRHYSKVEQERLTLQKKENELELLKKVVEENNEKMKQEKEQNERLSSMMKTLFDDNQKQEEKFTQMSNKKRNSEKMLEDKIKETDALKSEIAGLKKDEGKVVELSNQLREQSVDYETLLDQKNGQLEEMRMQLEEFEVKVDGLSKNLDKKCEELESQLKKMKELETEKKEADKSTDKLRGETADLKENVKKLEAEKAALTKTLQIDYNKRASLESDSADLQSKIDRLKEYNNDAVKDAEELKEKLKQQEEDYEQKLKDQSRRIAKLQKKTNKTSEKLKSLETNLATKDKELETQKEKIKRLKKSKRPEEQVKDLEQQVAPLSASPMDQDENQKGPETAEKISTLEAEVESLKQQLEDSSKNLTESTLTFKKTESEYSQRFVRNMMTEIKLKRANLDLTNEVHLLRNEKQAENRPPLKRKASTDICQIPSKSPST